MEYQALIKRYYKVLGITFIIYLLSICIFSILISAGVDDDAITDMATLGALPAVIAWGLGGILMIYILARKLYFHRFKDLGCLMWLFFGWWVPIIAITFIFTLGPFFLPFVPKLQGYQRCPHCRSIIPRSATRCSYCGGVVDPTIHQVKEAFLEQSNPSVNSYGSYQPPTSSLNEENPISGWRSLNDD